MLEVTGYMLCLAMLALVLVLAEKQVQEIREHYTKIRMVEKARYEEVKRAIAAAQQKIRDQKRT